MIILKSWLNDWINLDNITNDDISKALESLGFEIESFHKIEPNYKNIIVGKVIEIYNHPNADKVRVTKVDVGSKVYEIVCGAWNFEVGAVVPVALPKSLIKDNFLIDKRDIRGVQSNGMICSASELDLWDDHVGILKLDSKFTIGTDFSKTYSSVDAKWDIGVTPNRGDCMSHLGVARELSNYFSKELIKRDFELTPSIENIIEVNSGSTILCNSYNSIEIENFHITESCFSIKYRLSNIGVRLINNVVDYTNYILHDIGQPLHAFDRDKIFNKISVRLAKSNETLKTLDSQVRSLKSTDLLITDNDKPIALAGVMGGLETEVTESTKNLLIESAYFDKVSIMNTSRRLNLISDASIRFERGVDFKIQEYGLKRLIELFTNDQPVLYSEIQTDGKDLMNHEPIRFKMSEINKILGQDVNSKFIEKTLNYLKIEYEINDNEIIFTSPSWRYDLERPIDLIEEIAKHYGFNNFISTLPMGNNLNQVGDFWNKRLYFINNLSSNLFNEVQTLSFVSNSMNILFNPERESVKVINPIDKTHEHLRTNLLSSLLNVYKHNYENNSYSSKYYEINNIYDLRNHTKYKDIPNQEYTLGLLVPEFETNSDRRASSKKNDISYLSSFIAKLLPGINIEHMERPALHKNFSYLLSYNNKKIGFMGQLSYLYQKELGLEHKMFLSELNLDNININEINLKKFQPLSQFPLLKFDLSFNVPLDFKAELLISNINSLLSEYENNITIFDDFSKEKSRNLGVRIVTRSYVKTFNDEESTQMLNNIVDSVEDTFNIKLNKRG